MNDEPKTNNKCVISLCLTAGVFLLWAAVVTDLYARSDKGGVDADTMTKSESGTNKLLTRKASLAWPNTCIHDVDLAATDCMTAAPDDGADVTSLSIGTQAGGNVTQGYNGDMITDVVPITTPYYQQGLCAVNVHWHLGTEHYSAGEYDCGLGDHSDPDHRDMMEDTTEHTTKSECGPTEIAHRRKLAGKARKGYQCNLFDPEDEKYTKPYDWKFCDASMEVGQTYEVHWPHSTAGACGTPDQYQSPFPDGVFCNLNMEIVRTLTQQDIASNIGVQAQVFVVVNDEDFYYPDLIRGMIVEPEMEMGSDVAMYTGSTTGDSVNNEKCSSYTPITWHVDRKCHPISASSFDKMCADMMTQRDDMSSDLYAHGSRELVADHLVANNHANLLRA